MTALWRLILGNRIVRFIGGLLAGLLALLGYGALKERQGRQAARKQAKIDGLRADAKAEKLRDEIDNSLGSDSRGKLRAKWLRR